MVTTASGNALLPRNEFAASGNKGGIPFSGTVLGISSQIYISGISIGDKLGQNISNASGINLLPRNEFIPSGTALLVAVGSNISPLLAGTEAIGTPSVTMGSGHFTTLLTSGISRIPDTQPTTTSGGMIGRGDRPWDYVCAVSGVFPIGITLASPNGSGWTLGVDNAGGITTIGPYPKYVFGPSDIPNMVLWLDASDTGTIFQDFAASPVSGVTASGQRVGMWRDKSGQVNDLQQGTQARKGYYMTNVQNGLPAVAFSGAGGLVMDKNWDWPISGALNWTIMGIIKSITANVVLGYGLSATASGCIRWSTAGPGFLFKSINPVKSQQINTNSISQSNAFMSILKRDSLDYMTLRVSGSFYGTDGGTLVGTGLTGHIAPQSPNNRWELAGIASGTSSRITANLHEICVWAYALSEKQISAVSGYFSNKWGVAS